MGWPSKKPRWSAEPCGAHRTHKPQQGSKPVSPSVPTTTELTDPELGRLEGIEVILGEGVEIETLGDTAVPLPGKGRLTESVIVAPNRIRFTLVATTEEGVKEIASLQAGTTNIFPNIVDKGGGRITLNMNFVNHRDHQKEPTKEPT